MSSELDKHASLTEAFLSRPLKLFINGKWIPAASGETFSFENPSTGKVIGYAASGAAADVDLAVRAARAAFESGPWPLMPPAERAKLMLRLADAIDSHVDELVRLESLNGGNPLRGTRAEVVGAAERLRYNAGWTNKIFGDTMLSSALSNNLLFTLREPIGVVGAITPWNAPFFMAVGKIALAIAAGCTVVLKPAELTPASSVRLGELIADVGFPPGVVNIVTGTGPSAGHALVDHPGVDKLAFTGSTVVGKSILTSAAKMLKRVTLELGGKSPIVIFPDADTEAAARATAVGIVVKSGQFCAAGTRVYVHKEIFDKVAEQISAILAAVKIGPGLSPDTEMGPLISRKQLDKVHAYIDAGRSDGAEVLRGGERLDGEGYFIRPTILTNTRGTMSVMREEIFGPVLCLSSFDDDKGLDEVTSMANDTAYGLTARIWTRNLSVAHRLIRRIRSGSVNINGAGGAGSEGLPFGGYKQSGIGREGGHEGVEAYTEMKTVAIGY